MKRHLFALILVLASLPAWALPDSARQLSSAWQELGAGEMKWFGFRIYQVSLWTSGTELDFGAPFALEIRYERDIPRTRLVDSSIAEMRRLGENDEKRLQDWARQLTGVFPGVRKGETLTGVYLPNRGAVFYHGDIMLGEIADQDLARAFFGIWLDPATREPALRARLLGRPG